MFEVVINVNVVGNKFMLDAFCSGRCGGNVDRSSVVRHMSFIEE
jgi:hypothetical protein